MSRALVTALVLIASLSTLGAQKREAPPRGPRFEVTVPPTVRGGAVLDPTREDSATTGTRALYEALRDEPRVSATAIQTVGSKGYDGFVLARVL